MDIHSQNFSNDHFLVNSSHETKTRGYTRDGWTFEENKIYERAMTNFEDTSSVTFFEHVALLMPWQTMESIKKHEQILTVDMKFIKSSNGNFEDIVEEDSTGTEEEARKVTHRPKKKGIPWTNEEHRLFLLGLQEVGKGEWKAISKKYLPTKTPTQIASHAQKFMKRKNTKTPLEKRRASINDIKLCSEPSFTLDSQGFQPNQSDFLLDSPDFQSNKFTFPMNSQGVFQPNEFNFPLDFQNSRPNQFDFPLDSQGLVTNQFGNATSYNHVHNNY